jgi:predicted aldo/keto reductase-like oxidoreductase
VSEEYIGNALKAAGRENFYIATKAMSYTYDSMKESIELSLKTMGIDYIDLYQVHNVKTWDELEKTLSENGALKALVEAKEKGLIRHIGITGHIREILLKAIENDNFETVQFPFNPVESQGTELFTKALEKGMGTIGMKPIAGGAFGKPELSIKYIIETGLVTVTIPGMDAVEQVVSNTSVAEEGAQLTEDEKKEIEKEIKELGNNFCRRCGYCKPCPQGIDIPNVFLFEGYVTRYNLASFGKTRYDALPVKADACVACRKCEKKCPYSLPIVEKLKSAAETFRNCKL